MPTTWKQQLAQQDDVISRAQALAGGMSKHEWDWKLERGLWQRALPGVAVAHTGGTTERQRAWAAALHGGPGATVSGDTALRLAGLAAADGRDIDVVVPGSRTVAGGRLLLPERHTVVVHRVHEPERWARDVRGLPVMHTHAAVLQAASWAGTDRAAEWRVAAAVQRRITAPKLLRETLAEMPRLKRHALLLAVLDDVELGAHAGSELEFLRFCRKHMLPRPDELQVRLRVGRSTHYLDGRYRRQRVTVEVDGAHHRDVESWEADTLRTLRVAATLRGEQLLRLTPGLMRHDGEEVAALLRRILT